MNQLYNRIHNFIFKDNMMKLIYKLFLSVFLLSGCASTQPVNTDDVLIQALLLNPDSNITLWEIPSHGAIGDAASIASNGGGAADQLSTMIQNLSSLENATLVVTSSNPELPKAHIEGALSQVNYPISTLTIIYAGNVEYSEEIEGIVKGKGIAYNFIDTTAK